MQGEISRTRVASNMPPGPDCPAETDWINLAAGLLSESRAKDLMRHAAQCDHCGPLLKTAAETFADEATPGEETALASLPSASPAWRQNLVAILRDHVPNRHEKRRWWQGLFSSTTTAYAFAGVAAIALITWIGLRTFHAPSADQLLAQAYTERRTLEVRIPGAKYAPMRLERGAGASNLDKSPSLLRAEALIAEKLRAHPHDPAWLQARARADLLDGNYESAINSLQRALESQPDSPQLLADLGSAYYLRAESIDRSVDYGNAIESLGKALEKSPEDPVALFNRALACERMFLYTQAVDDWQHYLRIDPQGEWADEARKRLAAVRNKVGQHQKSLAEPLLEPREIARAGANEFGLHAKIDDRLEDYLRVALAEWLPAMHSGTVDAQSSATAAAYALAHDLASEHRDQWLEDLLASRESPKFATAIAALNRAMERNAKGDPADAERDAEQAKRLFAEAGNLAGYLRAASEQIYAFHRAARSKECLARETDASEQLGERPYSWIRAQLDMERASCLSMLGELGQAEKLAIAGGEVAASSGYNNLRLRSIGYLAGLAADTGDSNRAWEQNSLGLRQYWQGTYPSQRAYQFYDELDALAEEQNLRYLAVSFAREAVQAISVTDNQSVEAMARYQLARMAKMASNFEEASREFARAGTILGKLPSNDATQLYALDAAVSLADIELQRGEVAQAAARLAGVQARIATVDNYPIALRFYQTSGKLAQIRGQNNEAKQAFIAAVEIGEWGLQSLNDERDRLTWSRETSEAYRSLTEFELNTVGRPETALEIWEWYKSAGLRSRQHPKNAERGINFGALARQELPALDAINASLPSLRQETIISYAEFTDGLAIFAYDDRGIREKWVPVPAESLTAEAQRFRDLCADPTSDLVTLKQVGRQLYQWLIAPIAQDISTDRALVVEPDRNLQDVPFRALVGSDGKYLSELFTLLLSPGFAYELQLNSSIPISRTDRALVVGAPALVDPGNRNDLKALPDALHEAESVGLRFDDPRVITGRAATLEAVEQELPSASIFHFAGHAVSSPGGAGLVLANPAANYWNELDRARLLDAGRLHGRKFPQCQLVVLSACATTSSGISGLASPESLVRAFLRTGVPHVVASDWNVDSAVTASFMNDFYAALLLGKNVPVALEEASRHIRLRPETQHPYYWSAFVVFGNT